MNGAAKKERKNIVWLVSWYPNKYDLFDGDFIQRHAMAAAVHHNIHVIFVKDDPGQEVQTEEVIQREGLTEQIIYFPSHNGIFKKIGRIFLWRKLYLTALKTYFENNGKPAFLHVHVPWKAGLIALEVFFRYKIPYLVTEHWGIYNTIVKDNITLKSLAVRKQLKNIFKYCSRFISVSDYVGNGVQQYLLKKPFVVIPNVVDDSLFFYQENQYPVFTFIHVSNMVYLKKVEGILDAFRALILAGKKNIQLIMIGNNDDCFVNDAAKMGLSDTVIFKGEITYAEVATIMRGAHCLVVNSSIENSPCVIGEALCCGLPVITTAVGGIPELVNSTNSLITNEEKSLETNFKEMIDHYQVFDRVKIAQDAKRKFSVNAIASLFNEVYITQKNM